MLKSSYTTCLLVSEENETVIEVETERAGKVSNHVYEISKTNYENIFSSINGLVIPGGGVSLKDSGIALMSNYLITFLTLRQQGKK